MTRFISNDYKTNLADLFYDDVLINDYYIFISTIDSQISLENTTEDKKEFLRKTLFGKKVKSSDVFFAVKNYPWQFGTVYDQFDDIIDLTDKRFYAVVYPEDSNTGDYLVFKCISNNNKGLSEAIPFYDETAENQIYQLSDGYIWKFMYSLTEDEFDNYNAYGYIPIIEPTSAPVDNLSIAHITVENSNTNFGYAKTDCVIVGVDNQEIRLIPNSNNILSTFDNFYRGQSFHVVNFPTTASRIYEVLSYRWDPIANQGVVTLKGDEPYEDVVTYGSNVTFYPRIEIKGDGTGAEALPVISAGQIKAVLMVNGGSGYTQASVRVVDPEYNFAPNNPNTGDERAIIRAILSSEGHGQNIRKELFSNSILLYSRITESENIGKLLPTTSTYARIGLVKNPTFKEESNTAPEVFDNRIEVELLGSSNTFLANDIAQQVDPLSNEITFSSLVHESSGMTVYLAEYMGPYQNVANTDVSFNPNLPLRDSQNINYVINNHKLSNYVQRTGEVMYIASFATPITRSASTNEQYKLVLQF